MTPLLLAVCVLSVTAPARAAEPALLKDIRVEARRVVLKLSRPAAFRSKAEAAPPKLMITLSDTDIDGDEKDISMSKGMARWVSSARSEENGVPATRVTVHLDSARDYSPVWSGNDLVLEFKGAPPAAEEPAPDPEAAPAPKAAPAAPTPPAPPKAAAAKRAFWVQLGSFPEEAAAKRLKLEFEHLLDPLEVRKAAVGGKTVHRVAMGPFPDRPSASAALDKAAKQGQKGIITRD
ncbi:MAG: hypothetical protein FD126_2142 [Elusimicrobia bacterium]|nr:MAG: hypothetical protein FD126_2142 [Elusimicrobiota bacterium]